MNNDVISKFKDIRKQFPLVDPKRGITYFNSASTGPLCRPVRKALDEYYEMSQYSDGSTSRPDIDRVAFGHLDNIRKLGARMLGARQDEVGFGFNTGYGLNIAAQGLPLKKGDEVLLSEVEFPANVYPWLALRERGVKVKFVPATDMCFDIDKFRQAITSNTKVLSLSFVQFFNGFKNDLKTLGEICESRGIYFVVDGIQGCGAESIDVKKCQIDILSSGAQKWMLSPLGTAIFYVRKDLQPQLRQPLASWLSVDWKLNFTNLFHYDLPFFDNARRFELGTYPYAHVFALSKALEILTGIGIGNIQKHNHTLLDKLIVYLKGDGRFRITSSLQPLHRSSILSFTCRDAQKLYTALTRARIFASFREGSIRVSVHLFNNEADVEKLIEILDNF